MHLMVQRPHLIGDISLLPLSVSRIGSAIAIDGCADHRASRRPLISLIPAAHIAVVPSYPVLLVCISICDRIVSIFHLSSNIHSKNTNKLVLRIISFFAVLVSLLHGSVPRHISHQRSITQGKRIYHEFLDRVFFLADVGPTHPVVSLLLDRTFTGFSWRTCDQIDRLPSFLPSTMDGGDGRETLQLVFQQHSMPSIFSEPERYRP
ncbi:hypothetical protein EDB83DRAFT_988352 [Lactarius deliciosus]|nr:hypothetical protein EDB83DRAFT_988352 [Lactarius deliciosus]